MDGSDTNIVFNRERALNAIIAQLKEASAGMVLMQHLSTPKTQRHYLAHMLQSIAGKDGPLQPEHLAKLHEQITQIHGRASNPPAKRTYQLIAQSISNAAEQLAASPQRSEPPQSEARAVVPPVAPAEAPALSPNAHYQIDDVMGRIRGLLGDDETAQRYMHIYFANQNNKNGRISVAEFESIISGVKFELIQKKQLMGNEKAFADATKHLSALLRGLEQTLTELPQLVSYEQQQAARPVMPHRPAYSPAEPVRPEGSILRINAATGARYYAPIVPEPIKAKAKAKPAAPKPVFIPAMPRQEIHEPIAREPEPQPAILPEPAAPVAVPKEEISAPVPDVEKAKKTPQKLKENRFLRPENYLTSAGVLEKAAGNANSKELHAICAEIREAAEKQLQPDTTFLTIEYHGQPIALAYAFASPVAQRRHIVFRDDMVDTIVAICTMRNNATDPTIEQAQPTAPEAEAEKEIVAAPTPQTPGTIVSSVSQQDQRRAQVDRHISKNAFFSTHAQITELADAHGLQFKNLASPLALMLMTPEHFEEALDQAYRNTALLPDGEHLRALMDKLATQHERYSAANAALGRAA